MSKQNTAEIIGEDNKAETADERLSSLPGRQDMRDINRMMDQLEQQLGALDEKLDSSNQKIRQDVKRLLESDADIGDKVAEIYRQLGLVEARFDDLDQESTALRKQLQKLLKNIDSTREEALKGLADSLENQAAVNQGLHETQQAITERAESLARKTASLTRKLNKSIKENSLALTQLETRIVRELERIAGESEQRDENLQGELQQQKSETDGQLQKHQARMLKLQRVDEALDKRAQTLERRTTQLLEDNEELLQQTEMLSVVTERLDADVEALRQKSDQLAAVSLRHKGFIEQLQHSGRELSQQLLALGQREDRRFLAFSLFGLLLLIVVGLLFTYGQQQRIEDSLALGQRAIDTQNQIQDLQERALSQQSTTQQLDGGLANLQRQLTTVKKQLVEVNDQVASLDGRIQYIAPFQRFGGDNVIHGSQWLARLNPDAYSIQLATVDGKDDMFDLVQRYASYLPLELGYYPNPKGGFTLIYGGRFADAGEVEETLRELPLSMNFHTPTAVSNREFLAAISR